MEHERLSHRSPGSSTRGAPGPMSIATAPQPPVGRAGPASYTAISPHTTRANRPSHALRDRRHDTASKQLNAVELNKRQSVLGRKEFSGWRRLAQRTRGEQEQEGEHRMG